MTHSLLIATHFARWGLTVYLVWVLVLPETGLWTAVALTLLFAGVEVQYLNPRHWTKT